MWRILIIVVLAAQAVTAQFPFMNISSSWADRVDDLVGRLTLPEVMFQMAKGGAGPQGGPAPAIPRLGIEPWAWNTECLRGDAHSGLATGFPQALGLAAAFNPKLMFDIAEATGVEVRAKHNDYVKRQEYGDHKGLSCFSPVINIMRHPLWGRNQETYGEDPYLSGVYAAHFVRGLQGDHFRYVRANAGCKHFDVHGGPENIPESRFSFDAKVSERDWRLTFLPAFRQCVLAGSYSLMCSFNKINGIPACANQRLLTDITRKEWGFQGYFISDEEAVENLVLYHHYANSSMEAAIDCITAGLNIEITTSRKDPYFFTMKWGFKGYVISDEAALEIIVTWHNYTASFIDAAVASVTAGCNIELSGNNPAVYSLIVDAVNQGKLSEILVRERVKPLFYTRMRLGEFDPPEMNPYLQYNMSLVQVVGPMADNLGELYGSYAADPDPTYGTTPRQGLKPMSDVVNFASGCADTKCTNYSSSDIQGAVQNTQLVVICIGTGQEIESEDNDRRDMMLPGQQAQIIQDTIKYAPDVPILLLVFSAGPVNISDVDSDPRVSAIMQCFFPAQATGEALYNVVTMATDDASPAGRLPYTWYDTADQLLRPDLLSTCMKLAKNIGPNDILVEFETGSYEIPSMTEYTMTGRTYRYFKGSPLYPFGYGLSYTKFQYLSVELIPVIQAGDDQYLYGELIKAGGVSSYECTCLGDRPNETMPQLQLAAFDRYFVSAASTQEFKFVITPEQMAVWTDAQGFLVQPGYIDVYVGGQQPNQARSVGSNILTISFQIVGQVILGSN